MIVLQTLFSKGESPGVNGDHLLKEFLFNFTPIFFFFVLLFISWLLEKYPVIVARGKGADTIWRLLLEPKSAEQHNMSGTGMVSLLSVRILIQIQPKMLLRSSVRLIWSNRWTLPFCAKRCHVEKKNPTLSRRYKTPTVHDSLIRAQSPVCVFRWRAKVVSQAGCLSVTLLLFLSDTKWT